KSKSTQEHSILCLNTDKKLFLTVV
ncbi:hypothetical protein CP03DC29_0409B, partial [Chlamydia psittaci 03DC29]